APTLGRSSPYLVRSIAVRAEIHETAVTRKAIATRIARTVGQPSRAPAVGIDGPDVETAILSPGAVDETPAIRRPTRTSSMVPWATGELGGVRPVGVGEPTLLL